MLTDPISDAFRVLTRQRTGGRVTSRAAADEQYRELFQDEISDPRYPKSTTSDRPAWRDIIPRLRH